MARKGLVYLPRTALQGRPCSVHVALHGCQQSAAVMGETFARHTGYNEWAESNDIIVLYPQVEPVRHGLDDNPLASWDWSCAPSFLLDEGAFSSRIRQEEGRL